jgi:hypothetical protein
VRLEAEISEKAKSAFAETVLDPVNRRSNLALTQFW